MITILTIFHVIVSVFLILVVLLQHGKSADWAGTFGGGGSQTVFGSRGATTLLHKLTTGAAIIFMLTALSLTVLISRPGISSVIREGAKQEQAQPAQSGPQPPAAPAQGTPAQPAAPTPPKP